MPLNEFSNDERIFFGLKIIEEERKKKKEMSKAEEKKYNLRIEKLMKERGEFLKIHREKLKI